MFFFSSRRRHTRWTGDWSSDVCSSDLILRYCDKLGLRGPLYEKIADSSVQSSEADANDMLRIADVQSVGVMMGLDLAKLSPASKARICEKATTYVDKILRSKMEK